MNVVRVKSKRVLFLRWAVSDRFFLDQVAVRKCRRGLLFEVWNGKGGCSVHVGSAERLSTFVEFVEAVRAAFDDVACDKPVVVVRGRVGPGVSYYIEVRRSVVEHDKMTTHVSFYFHVTLFDFDSSYTFETREQEHAREWVGSFVQAAGVIERYFKGGESG